MKRKNLTGVLPGCFAMCLIALTSVSAQADWVLEPYTYSNPPYVLEDGGSLGANGYYSGTGNGLGTSTSPYDVITQIYVDVPSVEVSVVTTGSQLGYWTGSGTSTSILINMGASTSGYYQCGATSATTIQGSASATSGGYSVSAGDTTNYTYPTTFSFTPDNLTQDLNPDGGVNGVVFSIASTFSFR